MKISFKLLIGAVLQAGLAICGGIEMTNSKRRTISESGMAGLSTIKEGLL